MWEGGGGEGHIASVMIILVQWLTMASILAAVLPSLSTCEDEREERKRWREGGGGGGGEGEESEKGR
eukprot:753023-Hanusia_phi.AAC.4